MEPRLALIVGAGSGLSASLARKFTRHNMQVALAARNPDKLAALCGETGAASFACETAEPEEVAGLFDAVVASLGEPDVVVYNASARARGPIVTLVPEEVARAIAVSAYGGFLVAQQAARLMLPKQEGAILFTGASASVKGYPQSSSFAMGKFALRGLAQSMARELHPQNIHIGHIVIDGGIAKEGDPRGNERGPDALLDPNAIADSYFQLHRQPRSSWAWEIELRPWVETF